MIPHSGDGSGSASTCSGFSEMGYVYVYLKLPALTAIVSRHCSHLSKLLRWAPGSLTHSLRSFVACSPARCLARWTAGWLLGWLAACLLTSLRTCLPAGLPGCQGSGLCRRDIKPAALLCPLTMYYWFTINYFVVLRWRAWCERTNERTNNRMNEWVNEGTSERTKPTYGQTTERTLVRRHW